MPYKRVVLPQIGEITLAKRRGARNLRLSINARGQVRVSMPAWAPYATGLAFAKARSEWIVDQLKDHRQTPLAEGLLVGKAHRLHFRQALNAKAVSAKVGTATIVVSGPFTADHPETQAKARAACEKALRREAEKLLPQRLAILAERHNYHYKQVRVRKLTSRWGSCSHDKTISLSYYLMQLPWQLIDYVLLHELAHTKQLNHGPAFWHEFESSLPDAKRLRKDVRQHKPHLRPN